MTLQAHHQTVKVQKMDNQKIKIRSHAKINLSLDVTGVRENGYHDVAMVMQSIGLFDELTAEKNDTGEIRLSFAESDILQNTVLSAGPDNLVCKAARKFFEHTGLTDCGVNFVLKKNIPLEAGLAGGSTDAAAALKALNILFETGLCTEDLCKAGAKIGADIPFCVLGGTALAEGIGEILTPLPQAPGCHLLIVKPHKGISTRFAYDNLVLDESTPHPDTAGMINAIKKGDLSQMCEKLSNVLETVSIPALPEIGEIKKKMLDLGALGSLMCGSGSTVFGIFTKKTNAEKALTFFKENTDFLSLVTAFVNPAE